MLHEILNMLGGSGWVIVILYLFVEFRWGRVGKAISHFSSRLTRMERVVHIMALEHPRIDEDAVIRTLNLEEEMSYRNIIRAMNGDHENGEHNKERDKN